jgi:hypothetical protein
MKISEKIKHKTKCHGCGSDKIKKTVSNYYSKVRVQIVCQKCTLSQLFIYHKEDL